MHRFASIAEARYRTAWGKEAERSPGFRIERGVTNGAALSANE